MSRPKLLEYAVITMDAQPHPEGIYKKFLDYLYEKKVEMPYLGPNYVKLQTMYPSSVEGVYYGDFFRETRIDRLSDESGKLATKAQKDKFNPDNLKANQYIFPYLFFEADHLLFVMTRNDEGKKLSISLLANSLKTALQGIAQKEDVDLTVAPKFDSRKMLNVLNEYEVSKLKLLIRRPNGDGAKGVQDLFDDMKEGNIHDIRQEYNSELGKPLKETARISTFMHAAEQCGEAEANVQERIEGTEKTKTKTIKSTSFPIMRILRFDPKLNRPLRDIFLSAAQNALAFFRNK